MKFLILVFLALNIGGCVTSKLVRVETGERIDDRHHVTSRQLDPNQRLSLSLVPPTTGEEPEEEILLKLEYIERKEEKWEEQYKQIGVYEEKCKGWMHPGYDYNRKPKSDRCGFRFKDFVLFHLLISGFAIDVMLPFMPYEDDLFTRKAPLPDHEKRSRSEIVEKVTPASGRFKFIVGGKEIHGEFKEGWAEFPLSSILVSHGKLETAKHVELVAAGASYNMTKEYNELISEIQDRREREVRRAKERVIEERQEKIRVAQQKAMDAQVAKFSGPCERGSIQACLSLAETSWDAKGTALRKLCERNYKSSCEEYVESFSGASEREVAAFLHPDNLDAFDFGMGYPAMSLKVIQRVLGGYLVTPNIPGEYQIFGVAYLKTKRDLQVNSSFCTRVYYVGQFDYVSAMGAPRTVPKFVLNPRGHQDISRHCMAREL